MRTKRIVYRYTQRVYASRQIATATRVTIAFMRLTARHMPDFRTTNRFRSERMKALMDGVFTAVLQLLVGEGLVVGLLRAAHNSLKEAAMTTWPPAA